jgi:MOSC domain-containing protein YiiM
MGTGTVERIHVASASGEPMEAVDAVDAVAGRGLRGDRYYDAGASTGTKAGTDPDGGATDGDEMTFIESEALEAVARDADVRIEPGAHRRNVTTRNVPLNHLVGERFTVGGAVCEGVELCEPCGYLQSLVDEEGLVGALVHRGGLTARILDSGRVAVGDEIEW